MNPAVYGSARSGLSAHHGQKLDSVLRGYMYVYTHKIHIAASREIVPRENPINYEISVENQPLFEIVMSHSYGIPPSSCAIRSCSTVRSMTVQHSWNSRSEVPQIKPDRSSLQSPKAGASCRAPLWIHAHTMRGACERLPERPAQLKVRCELLRGEGIDGALDSGPLTLGWHKQGCEVSARAPSIQGVGPVQKGPR